MFALKSILVTGGTGSFGKAFVRTVLDALSGRPAPGRSIRATNSSSTRWRRTLPAAVPGAALLHRRRARRDRLTPRAGGVDIVVHAAALKQVPAAEYNPFECIKTNVLGAQNVIEACLDSGVKRVVALSTDKAATPINLYGATKLCSDKMFVAGQQHQGQPRPALLGGALRQRDGQPRLGDSVLPGTPGQAACCRSPTRQMTRFNITLARGRGHGAVGARECVGRRDLRAQDPELPDHPTSPTAIGPDCEHAIVGIRPGEKLHEEMITASDSSTPSTSAAIIAILPGAGGACAGGLCRGARRQARPARLCLQQRRPIAIS